MKKLLSRHFLALLFFLFCLSFTSMAQNKYFYYVRFDPQEGDASAIVNEIDRVANSHPDQLIVMLSWEATPKISTDVEGWKNIRNSILTQQNTLSFYERNEEDAMNKLFSQYFDEHVRPDDGKLKISGSNDSRWTVCFVMSERMWEEDFEIVPLEVSKINELTNRDLTVRWLSYGEDSRLQEREEPRHPFYE